MKKAKENLSVALGVTITLVLAVEAYRLGLPKKWETAIYGTTVPFAFVTASYPLRWRRWSFWAAFTICLAVHVAVIWGFFEYVVGGIVPGWLLWTPIAFVEAFALLVVVRRVENKITGKHEAIRIS